MIEIDGSREEGGGQMLRNALALSTLTGKPFVIRDIRAKRPEPGLKQQHLMAVRALGSVTGARYKGASVGSTEVEFCPGSIKPGKYEIDIGTAGSITLLLQAFLLPIVVSRQTLSLRISGGTDVEWSQPWDHFCQVLLPHIRRQCNLEARLIRRGYYPKGGGLVELTFSPKQMIEPIRLERQASLEYVSGISNASTSLAERRVAERQGEAAKQALDAPVSIETSYSDSLSPGSGITLIAHFSENQVLGASALGARSKTAEAVGREAAMQLKEALGSGAPIDRHLGDQLLNVHRPGDAIYVPEVTGHIKSGLYVAEMFGKTLVLDGRVIRAL